MFSKSERWMSIPSACRTLCTLWKMLITVNSPLALGRLSLSRSHSGRASMQWRRTAGVGVVRSRQLGHLSRSCRRPSVCPSVWPWLAWCVRPVILSPSCASTRHDERLPLLSSRTSDEWIECSCVPVGRNALNSSAGRSAGAADIQQTAPHTHSQILDHIFERLLWLLLLLLPRCRVSALNLRVRHAWVTPPSLTPPDVRFSRLARSSFGLGSCGRTCFINNSGLISPATVRCNSSGSEVTRLVSVRYWPIRLE